MRLPRSSWVWLGTYAVVATLTLVTSGLGLRVVSAVAFACAVPVLAGVLVSGRPRLDRLRQRTLVALVFSWLGDWVPELVGGAFLLKVGLFALAHLAFVVAFWPSRRRSAAYRLPVLVAYAVVVGGLLAWLVPRSGPLAGPLLGYGVLLGAMAVLSTGVAWPAGVGGALFVVSDLTIAVGAFVLGGRHPAVEVVVVVTYLAAQLLLVLGVLRTAVPAPASGVRPGSTGRAAGRGCR